MPPTLATASIQGVGLLLSMDQRSAWPAAVRTDKRSGIKAKLSPRSGSALTSAHSVAIFVLITSMRVVCPGFRPYSKIACSVPKPTSCTNFWEGGQMFLGALPSFFLQSRSVVLDWGHTPGEHAQCHKTRNSHIEKIHFFFIWVDGCWPPAPNLCRSPSSH